MNIHKLESVWNQMKQRCRNPNNEKYRLYGEKGVEVKWSSFSEFREWALNTGYAEGLTIDRIDSDGNYEPDNCRWATPREQANNLSTNRHITAFGETKTVAQWVEDERCPVNYDTLIQRLRKTDWTAEEMVTTPSQPNGQKRLQGTKTHCPQGHDLSIHKRVNRRGDYNCGECQRIRGKKAYERAKQRKQDGAA